jgi:hypothetical protein
MADPEPNPWRHASVAVATQEQTAQKVSQIVATLLGRAGCVTCGRLIRLSAEFGVDPGPDLGKNGVTSVSFD